MIIDGLTLETGSFNYSAAASRNAENVLVLWNASSVANSYEQQWQKLWNEGSLVKPAY
jgi:phosphatidylserine/phosphatidylglycerophosphate/cardiolipin synthase-like enzyme